MTCEMQTEIFHNSKVLLDYKNFTIQANESLNIFTYRDFNIICKLYLQSSYLALLSIHVTCDCHIFLWSQSLTDINQIFMADIVLSIKFNVLYLKPVLCNDLL